MQSIPRLESERFNLRAIYPTDAQAIYEIYSDPKVTQFSELKTMGTISDAERLIANFTQWFQHDMGVRWGMYQKESDQLIGVCCFDTHVPKYQSTNVAYDISSKHWGNGYATECTSAVIEFAFESGLVSPINRIQAIVHVDNLVSERVLKKLGFEKEGLMRQYGFWDKQFHDMTLWSLLKRDS